MSAHRSGSVAGDAIYLRPLGIAAAAGTGPGAVPLAGGALRFALCEVIRRTERCSTGRAVVPVEDLPEHLSRLDAHSAEVAQILFQRLTGARPPFAGIAMDRPGVMGVLNITPDSFSDGGDRFDAGRAIEDGLAMREAGAALLDVGGESTRPGADAVPLDEELRRVVPVVRGLAAQGAPVSIDSRRARVMAAALEAGAAVINDVTALAGDPDSLALAARAGVPVILMHMQGEPRTMQADPTYDDAALDVYDYLAGRVAACEAAGIGRDRIMLDPGIGFGKTVAHNLEILEQLALYHGLGCALLLGVSRKSFIARLSGNAPPKARVAGSLAATLAGVARGVQMLRMHDVAETVQALEVWQAIAGSAPPAETAPNLVPARPDPRQGEPR
jgi:dihydropteroate synthase